MGRLSELAKVARYPLTWLSLGWGLLLPLRPSLASTGLSLPSAQLCGGLALAFALLAALAWRASRR